MYVVRDSCHVVQSGAFSRLIHFSFKMHFWFHFTCTHTLKCLQQTNCNNNASNWNNNFKCLMSKMCLNCFWHSTSTQFFMSKITTYTSHDIQKRNILSKKCKKTTQSKQKWIELELPVGDWVGWSVGRSEGRGEG